MLCTENPFKRSPSANTGRPKPAPILHLKASVGAVSPTPTCFVTSILPFGYSPARKTVWGGAPSVDSRSRSAHSSGGRVPAACGWECHNSDLRGRRAARFDDESSPTKLLSAWFAPNKALLRPNWVVFWGKQARRELEGWLDPMC